MSKSRKPKIEAVHVEEAERLKAIYNARVVISQDEFGARTGIGSQGMVWQYLNARSALNLDAAAKFCAELNCRLEDFSPRLAAEAQTKLAVLSLQSPPPARVPAEEMPGSPSDEDYALVPQYSAKGGCGPAYHNGHVEVSGGLAFKRDWLARMGLKSEALSVIAAHGDSMAPTLADGEVLLLDHAQVEPRDGKIYALDRGGELLIKRLVRDFSGAWIVRSDNPDKVRFGDVPVSDTALRIVARVVWRGGGL